MFQYIGVNAKHKATSDIVIPASVLTALPEHSAQWYLVLEPG